MFKFDLGLTNLVQHKIDTKDEKSVKIPPRRVPLAQRKEVETEIQKMSEFASEHRDLATKIPLFFRVSMVESIAKLVPLSMVPTDLAGIIISLCDGIVTFPSSAGVSKLLCNLNPHKTCGPNIYYFK
jgi:hypothetical protein